MKTAQQIAQTLLNRRNAMNPVVMQGEMINALGSDGLQEALSRRWLVPDETTGFLLVSQDMTRIADMRKVAEEKSDKAPVAENKSAWDRPWPAPNASHDFAVRHSVRPLNELLSPATGHDTESPLRAAPPATPTAPPSTVAPAGMQKPEVGDEVVVVSKPTAGATESQTYTGKVSSAANGLVKINFGNAEREYPESEVKILKKTVPGR